MMWKLIRHAFYYCKKTLQGFFHVIHTLQRIGICLIMAANLLMQVPISHVYRFIGTLF